VEHSRVREAHLVTRIMGILSPNIVSDHCLEG
jgi:hypothetical protein